MDIAPILIRQATAGDVETLVGLLDQLFAIERDFTFDAGVHRRGIEMLLADTGHAWVWVAVTGGVVAGMCTAQRLVSTASGCPSLHIEDVVVDARHRGTAVGSALMSHVENWAVVNGYGRLELVADRCNALALAFYQKRHWERTNMIWHRKHVTTVQSPIMMESGDDTD